MNNFSANINLNLLALSFFKPFLVVSGFLYNSFNQLEVNCASSIANITSLLVGYYNIHPLLLYVTIHFLLTKFLVKQQLIFISMNRVFLIGLLSFVLGGYWGLGNSVWGYFWVNDTIEQLLFWTCAIALYAVHRYQSVRVTNVLVTITLGIVIYLIVIRAGLISTRHSFFSLDNINNAICWYTTISVVPTSFGILVVLGYMTKWTVVFLLVIYYTHKLFSVSFTKLYVHLLHLLIAVAVLTWLKYTSYNFSFLNIVANTKTLSILFNMLELKTSNLLLLEFNSLPVVLTSSLGLFGIKVVGNYLVSIKYVYTIFVSVLAVLL